MFGLTFIKMLLTKGGHKAIIGIVLVLAVFGVYKYINNLEDKIEKNKIVINNLEVKNEFLEMAIQKKSDEIEEINTINKDYKKELDVLADNKEQLRNRLWKVLVNGTKRDIGYLAAEKPYLIEKIVNKASDNIFRCFEIASGDPLTDKEKDAVKRSQINTECPNLANPNYKKEM